MKEINIISPDGLVISCLYNKVDNSKATIQIIHGMCEHKERYIPLVLKLAENGYSAIVSDLRGHGKSINDVYKLGNPGSPDILVEDQYEITKFLKSDNKSRIIIFSHSMGTLISRAYIMKYDKEINGLILSGTVCINPMAALAVLLSKLKCIGKGKNKTSSLLYALSNGFSFKDDVSWLSYNEDNCKAYIDDPLCGFKFTNYGYLTLFTLVRMLTKKKEYKCYNEDLPIYSLSGTDDRTTGGTKGLIRTMNALKKAGYNKISYKEYPNMKHEILNENDNDIVYVDTIKIIGEIL